MKHFLFLIVAMFIGSTSSIGVQAKSSPIKLSALRKNKGKIVRTIPLDISAISAYIDDKSIQIDFSFMLSEVIVSIYDEHLILVYQEVIKSNSPYTCIDISQWENGKYNINFTDQNYVSLIGDFYI